MSSSLIEFVCHPLRLRLDFFRGSLRLRLDSVSPSVSLELFGGLLPRVLLRLRLEFDFVSLLVRYRELPRFAFVRGSPSESFEFLCNSFWSPSMSSAAGAFFAARFDSESLAFGFKYNNTKTSA